MKTFSEHTLLIVDDDEGLLILMAETLREEGYTVATAATAAAARTWLEAQTPALLIIDLNLPDGRGPALVGTDHRVLPPVVRVARPVGSGAVAGLRTIRTAC